MKIANNILETIGNTPLVKLNKITAEIPCTVLAKVETFNPGNSTKDRMALKMVEDAEADGRLKPGGTIVEGTSGNTGMGLALAAVVKGYKLICVITDKQSKEKVDVLKAVGAEVVVCPTDVAPDDPRSYYSVSKRLATETPNAWYVNQYDNPSNAIAHYEQTGPEIWEQTEGKVTHFIVGVGTGGTISGVAKYLKEQNPNIKIWGVDTYGSVFKKYHETGIFDDDQVYSYVTEGIGEDILPENVDFSLIDGFTKVTDKDAAVYTRKLAREEGIFVGNSAGSAIKGTLQLKENFKADDVVVVLFHDSGSRYIGKIFNDDWMRAKGYIETPLHTIADAIKEVPLPDTKVRTEELLSHAVERMQASGLEILPVFDHKKLVGTLYSATIWQTKISQSLDVTPVLTFMKEPLPVVEIETPLTEIQRLFAEATPAVFVKMSHERLGILTPRWLMKILT
jgi:cystathionine beta-synthase